MTRIKSPDYARLRHLPLPDVTRAVETDCRFTLFLRPAINVIKSFLDRLLRLSTRHDTNERIER